MVVIDFKKNRRKGGKKETRKRKNKEREDEGEEIELEWQVPGTPFSNDKSQSDPLLGY